MWLRKLISLFTGGNKKPKALLPEQVSSVDNGVQQTIQSSTTEVQMETEQSLIKFEQEVIPEFRYLEQLIRYRLNKYFPEEKDAERPDFEPGAWRMPLADFIEKNSLDQDAATLLLIALVPHVEPHLFNRAIENKLPEKDTRQSINFPQIGGTRGTNSRFFLPTGETALFLIADDYFERRLQVQQLFGSGHIFSEKKILWLEDMQAGEPAMHGRIIISPDYIELFTYGMHRSPQFSITFPAKKIAPATKGNPPSFEQLVIPAELHEQINEIKSWLKYNDILAKKFGMEDRIRKGYRTLFYGPPGTGKTFTAQILGNDLKKEVYKIDLSMIISKYIGETEKNLELLFARAEDKGWILFFDEADALFGKRTNVRDAHDKYANQEVSYLLQRIEDYNGLVILATNMKNNIDEAFIRRFNSILKFPFPDASQRALIWRKSLPPGSIFMAKRVNGDTIAEEPADIPEAVKKYELTGGNIINVVQYAGIKGVEALNRKSPDDDCLTIYLGDVLDGIKRELLKEGKPFAL